MKKFLKKMFFQEKYIKETEEFYRRFYSDLNKEVLLFYKDINDIKFKKINTYMNILNFFVLGFVFSSLFFDFYNFNTILFIVTFLLVNVFCVLYDFTEISINQRMILEALNKTE